MGDVPENRIRFLPQSEPMPGQSTRTDTEDPRGRFGNFIRYRGKDEGNCAKKCNIIFPQTVYRKVMEHLAHDTSREHGGFLLGYEIGDNELGIPTVVVEDAVAAKFTEGTPVRLTFTTETFRDLDVAVDNSSKFGWVQQRIGWYHSHPNISIFLSHWDLDVCKTFDRRRLPIALVVDPVRNCGGFFVGGKGGYQPHCPQGFLEKPDLQAESVVTWSNVTRVNSTSDGQSFDLRVGSGSSGLVRWPAPQKKSRLNQTVVLILALIAITASGLVAVNQWRIGRHMRQFEVPLDRVLVTPGSAVLAPGQKTQFIAMAGGAGHKAAILWSLNPPDPTSGSIAPDGIYTAPSFVSTERTVTVMATAEAARKFGIAIVKLMPSPRLAPATGVPLAVSPSTAQVGPSGKVLFTAWLGRSSTRDVNWSTEGPGSISSQGVYVAPPKIRLEETVTVTATSTTDTNKFAVATIGLEPVSGPGLEQVQISLNPRMATVRPSQNVPFTLEVIGTRNLEVKWSLNPKVGTLVKGVYTAPSSISQNKLVTVKVESVANPTKFASSTLILTAATPEGSATVSLDAGKEAPTKAANGPDQLKTNVSPNPGMPQPGTDVNATATSGAPGGTANSNTADHFVDSSVETDPKTRNPTVLVNVDPTNLTLAPSESKKFSANVSGTNDKRVKWTVDDPKVGSVSAEGVFTASSAITARSVTYVTATSNTDPSRSGTATVVVSPK
jgi:proteasome lid subunit RPN8/RPN11